MIRPALSRAFARIDPDAQDRIVGGVALGLIGMGLATVLVVYVAALAVGAARIVSWLWGVA